MRALFVGQTYIPNFNRQKLRLIASQGIEIGLLAPANWQNLDGLFQGHPAPIEPSTEEPAIRIFGARTWRPGHHASFLYDPRTVREALSNFRPDVVQVEQEVYSFASAQIASQIRREQKMVIFSWENLDRPVHPLQRIARKIALKRVNGIISGNSTGVPLMRKWGFPGPTKILPQVGIDPTRYPERSAEENRPLQIGFVGRLVPEKGGDTLLKAASRLAAKGHDFRLFFCGTGPCADAWREISTELGLADRTRWQGSVPHGEVPQFMAEMDILVLPSKTIPSWAEQFGLVLPQAMMVGVPVVGSDCGAIPEVIGREEAIFPEGDPAALAAILERLLTSPELRRSWRTVGRARALAVYTAEHVARETVNFWRDLLSDSTRA
jgi:glycosyltransferase involved in cell wall biosynthesis